MKRVSFHSAFAHSGLPRTEPDRICNSGGIFGPIYIIVPLRHISFRFTNTTFCICSENRIQFGSDGFEVVACSAAGWTLRASAAIRGRCKPGRTSLLRIIGSKLNCVMLGNGVSALYRSNEIYVCMYCTVARTHRTRTASIITESKGLNTLELSVQFKNHALFSMTPHVAESNYHDGLS